MNNKLIAAALCAGVSFAAAPASADQASDLAELKAQMTQMQREYAARMAVLEKRLAKSGSRSQDRTRQRGQQIGERRPKQFPEQFQDRHCSIGGDCKKIQRRRSHRRPCANRRAIAPRAAGARAERGVAGACRPRPPRLACHFEQPLSIPGIAAVFNGFFVAASRDPANIRIPGFALGDEAQGPQRGFSLGESRSISSAKSIPFFWAG